MHWREEPRSSGAKGLYSPNFLERLSGNSYTRANRLTISRVIAA
jgi:hypothetical protein